MCRIIHAVILIPLDVHRYLAHPPSFVSDFHPRGSLSLHISIYREQIAHLC